MSPSSRIRMEARGRLRGNWAPALAFVAVFLLCSGLLIIVQSVLVTAGNFPPEALLTDPQIYANPWYYAVTAAPVFFGILFFSPLLLGFLRWHFALSTEQAAGQTVRSAFSYFESAAAYGRALRLTGGLALRICLWYIVCILPGRVLVVLSVLGDEGTLPALSVLSPIFALLGSLLFLAGIVLFVNRLLGYFLAPFFFFADDSLPAGVCICRSIACMRGRRGRVIALILSFLGWFVSCIFIFPAMYVLPYFLTALSTCAKWILVEASEREAATLQPSGVPFSPPFGSAGGSTTPVNPAE